MTKLTRRHCQHRQAEAIKTNSWLPRKICHLGVSGTNIKQSEQTVLSIKILYLGNKAESLNKLLVNQQTSTFNFSSQVTSCSNIVISEKCWNSSESFEHILEKQNGLINNVLNLIGFPTDLNQIKNKKDRKTSKM